MTIKEITNKLLAEGYLVLIDRKPVLTAKFEKEIGYGASQLKTASQNEQLVLRDNKIVTELIKPTSYTDNPKEVWNAFIADVELPHRVSDGKGGQYTIRHYSLPVAKRLMKIIADPKIDYTRLVQSTKHYYKTVTYKNILSNYIDKGIWEGEYEQWDNKIVVNQQIRDGSNRWESE